MLAWLFGEAAGEEVRRLLAGGEIIITSELTVAECERVLIRAAALKEMAEGEAADRRAQLAEAAADWHLLQISADVLLRVRQPFPLEPVRTPDAIHLASALVARSAIPGLQMLSLDERIRSNARGMSIPIQPSDSTDG